MEEYARCIESSEAEVCIPYDFIDLLLMNYIDAEGI